MSVSDIAVVKPPQVAIPSDISQKRSAVKAHLDAQNRKIKALDKAHFDSEVRQEEIFQRAINSSIVGIRHDIKKSKLKKVFFISFLVLLALFVCSVVGLVIFYNIAKDSKELWALEVLKNLNLSSELDYSKKKELFQESIISWNNEQNKSIYSLSMSDFSGSPISGTPEKFLDSIESVSLEYQLPASIISAQIWQESRFNENCVYLGYKHKEISNWEQRWNSSREAYDIYVQYNWDRRKRWNVYRGEVSVGLAQRNLGYGAHDSIKADFALNVDNSIKFVGSRWRDFLNMYPQESALYLAMAYNNVRAANNAKNYLSVNRDDARFMTRFNKRAIDVSNAKFIIRYGEDVISIARNQRLMEIHEELFGRFKDDKDFNGEIPEINLLFVNQTDYHDLIGYESDQT